LAGYEYDVLIVGSGSGFGGSVAALRAAAKGYRVAVMESGRRWNDEDIPKTQWDLPHFLWFPAGRHHAPVHHVKARLWPNKGEADSRPPLDSGYERVDPVMPNPLVPREPGRAALGCEAGRSHSRISVLRRTGR
jgi:choline dehydrogenase-like flavoprotein